MDILNAIEKLREYKEEKEEKQRKEEKLYEEECKAYENIIQSMSNEMDQVLELKKLLKNVWIQVNCMNLNIQVNT